ncbi:hypothetical protein OEV98_09035 [Caldibacillus lycopersici]|uniref:Uncharacterized protein n=1 Tax=Perspicuibacillus lycopersici TaxID=1325689 RepID=A0AAE3LQN5_9BACI|nr:hypothetical protein [Perspicuibacillus lycopersici]MCU9613704.1 hypothetical protein [Perspicuibacillus lycopersici]
MTYIIENANLYKQNRLENTSLLVDEGKILSVQQSFARYRYMKMNAQNFLMTSTHVFYMDGLPVVDDSFSSKNYFINKFLLHGCTTLLVSTPLIQYVHEIESEVYCIREFFEKCPLDFTIGVRIPIENFSVQMVQKCKRAKIPAIFIEIDNPKWLYKIPWGWIREAMFPYNCPLIPITNETGDNREKLLQLWNTMLTREKIPHIDKPLQEQTPLSLDVLKKIGIYPMKGYLQAGGELSYNLYLTEKEPIINELTNDFLNLPLAITVHKGDVIRVGKKIYYHPKKGEELIISRPSFFK